jgi:glutathione S-transferase
VPLNPGAEIEVTALRWVPAGPRGLVKDLRVRWALEEAGLDYRIRLVGGERPLGYEMDQPFCQVPCFRDGSVRIFESGAILQYLGERTEVLLPSGHEAKYRAIQWTYAAANSVEPFVQFRALLNSFWADRDWTEGAKPTFDELAQLRLGQLSKWLGDKQWLEDNFTIGDIMMVTVLRLADRSGQLDGFDNLAEYVKRGEARPAFQRALADQLAAYDQNEPQPQGEAA